jgi:hypothetical protein
MHHGIILPLEVLHLSIYATAIAMIVVRFSIVRSISTMPFSMGTFIVRLLMMGSLSMRPFTMGFLMRRFLVLLGRPLRAPFVLDHRVMAFMDGTCIVILIGIHHQLASIDFASPFPLLLFFTFLIPSAIASFHCRQPHVEIFILLLQSLQ